MPFERTSPLAVCDLRHQQAGAERRDHETRIRQLEVWRWKLTLAVSLLAFAGGSLGSLAAKLF